MLFRSVCAESGLATLSARREDPIARESGFLALRRGDCLRASGLERRDGESNFGIAPGSRLEMTFRAPDADGRASPDRNASAGRRVP